MTVRGYGIPSRTMGALSGTTPPMRAHLTAQIMHEYRHLEMALVQIAELLDTIDSTLGVVSCPGQPDVEASSAIRVKLAEVSRSAVSISQSVVSAHQQQQENQAQMERQWSRDDELQRDYARQQVAYTEQRDQQMFNGYGNDARDFRARGDIIHANIAWQPAPMGLMPLPSRLPVVAVHDGKPYQLVTAAPDEPSLVRRWSDKVESLLRSPKAAAKAAEALETEQAKMVFSYWQVVMSKQKSVMDPKRLTRIKTRLRENMGDVSELLYAIDAATKDDWLMGRDQRSPRAYNGIETIFRDREQVERLAEKMGGFKRGDPHPSLKVMQDILTDDDADAQSTLRAEP